VIHKRFEEIERADIEALLENETRESRTLEYKEKLPSRSRDDRKEFLADVSAFANAAGGDLLYGVREQRDAKGNATGIPAEIPGIETDNIDAELLRLTNMLRDNIEPRLYPLQIRAVDGFPKGPVILIRVGQSWNGPHMVTLNYRIYSRRGTQTYPLDVSELRSAFLLSERLSERLRRFRDERLARIIADETPVQLEPEARLVVHMVPVKAMQPDNDTDVYTLLNDHQARQLLRPMYLEGGWNPRYNFDGFVTYRESYPVSYLQLFSSGAMEWVADCGDIVRKGEEIIPYLPAELTAKELLGCLRTGKEVFSYLEIQPPYFLSVGLIGVRGYRLAMSGSSWLIRQYTVDRDTLVFPDIRIDDRDFEPTVVMRPILDTLWRAVGYSHCGYYDDDGTWIGPRLI